MSIKIEIVIPDHVPSEKYLSDAMKAIGFVRADALMLTPAQIITEEKVRAETRLVFESGEASPTTHFGDTIKVSESPGTGAIASVVISSVDSGTDPRGTFTEPKMTAMDGDRERGKAGPGHRRRTDKQIAEDTAYFASLPASAPLAPGADAPLISTGEERISPEDAADEAAETAAHATDKPTLETLRAAVGRYTETFGAKASIENIRAIIGKPMIEVAEEELPAAIARVEAATRGETIAVTTLTETAPIPESVFGDALADKPTEPVHATKADVIEAFAAYGKKYDGVSDPKLMTITREDLPKVLEGVFGAGAGATTVAKIPQTPEGFGKAMTAVYAAVRDNPFKRTPK